MMLALPGSAYLYQGEELGLLEVADLPADALQDPVYERTGHRLKGRDGCRVPLPWTPDGSSFGFGGNGSWLPQPPWFTDYAASSQSGHLDSSLELYRRAIALRRDLADCEHFSWIDTGDPQVLRFARSDEWHCLINFSSRPAPIPGRLILNSEPGRVSAGTTTSLLSPEAAAWFRPLSQE
ncbi:DUF3459 domain-containing protein [Terrabacter terrigena]|uniref:DUF3459 domain-containing protein n=1 Tax=Terrabacter terrigena TaxID=574718 RepID=A0ABW3MSC2_9MICO